MIWNEGLVCPCSLASGIAKKLDYPESLTQHSGFLDNVQAKGLETAIGQQHTPSSIGSLGNLFSGQSLADECAPLGVTD